MTATLHRDVSFYSGPALKQSGVLDVPGTPLAAPHKARPAVILCHGPGGNKEHLVDEVSRVLVEGGYVVLRYDYRGWGASEGPKWRIVPLEQAEDVGNAITFLQQQPEVDRNRIGLWGTATGATLATYVAGVDTRVRCLVAVHAVGDMGRWMRGMRRYWEWVELLRALEQDRVTRALTGQSRLIKTAEAIIGDPSVKEYIAAVRGPNPPDRFFTLDSLEAMLGFRPDAVVSRISPRAAMWICALEDVQVPIEESQRMYELASEPKRLLLIPGVRHQDLYVGDGLAKMTAAALEWFNRHLTP